MVPAYSYILTSNDRVERVCQSGAVLGLAALTVNLGLATCTKESFLSKKRGPGLDQTVRPSDESGWRVENVEKVTFV